MEWRASELLGEFGETFRRRRQPHDGRGGKWWMREGEGKRKRMRAVRDTFTDNTLARCQSEQLSWLIFPLFSISLCIPRHFPPKHVLIPTLCFYYLFFHPLWVTSDIMATVTSVILKQAQNENVKVNNTPTSLHCSNSYVAFSLVIVVIKHWMNLRVFVNIEDTICMK